MAINGESAAKWDFDGRVARFTCGALQAVVDVGAPSRGLARLEYCGAAVNGWLLGVSVDAEPSDAYVRGGDLIVAYRETAERPFSVQVYWSAAPDALGAALILDATVSIQTRQWETYPRVTVQSSLDGAAVTTLDAGTALLRPAGADWSYVEVAPAEDFVALAANDGDRAPASGATGWVFPEQFMERGVIRRLRLRGGMVPRRDDAATATRLRAALLAEQPPLTA